MNAMEHGNGYDADLAVRDRRRPHPTPSSRCGSPTTAAAARSRMPSTPDIEAKLEGRQSPRGWGLFLIQNMVDEVRTEADAHRHTLELIMHLEGGGTPMSATPT